MLPSRCCIDYVSKSGRASSGHRTGKGQSSSQFPRRVVLKNVLIIRQLHSSPVLVKVKSLSRVRLFATPWTVAYQGFSRQEYWSGLPFPSPGDLPNSGIVPRSPTLQADALPSEPSGKHRTIGGKDKSRAWCEHKQNTICKIDTQQGPMI